MNILALRPTPIQKIAIPCYRNAFRAKRSSDALHTADFKRLLSNKNVNPAASAAVPQSFLSNPLRWYVSKLETHPLTTKCITSGIISGAGDFLCQYLVAEKSSPASLSKSHASTPLSIDDENHVTSQGANKDFDYDYVRTVRFAILGSFLVAPTVHAWYGYLMSSIPGSSVGAIAKRLFCDQGLFAPVFLPTFVSCLTLLEHLLPDGGNGMADGNGVGDDDDTPRDRNDDLLSRVTTRLRNDVPEALVVGWSMWIPSMAFMFAFVPGKFQVLFSNGVGFFWNAYLSWRTHEGEQKGEDTRGSEAGIA